MQSLKASARDKSRLLEMSTVQKLVGKDIDDVLKEVISRDSLKRINDKLNEFLNGVEETLENYQYKKPTKRQANLTFSDINERVIDAFFSIRVLNKKMGDGDRTPVSHLSSGEKRKALVDLAYAFLKKSSHPEHEIILAMDEPESSLHSGAIFEQFEKLYDINNHNIQTLATTHWYGFLPVIPSGSAISIIKYEEKIEPLLIELDSYKEDIRKQKEESRGQIPSDISLKSTNDLVQTIMASIRKDQPYNWIICEGSSERIYFEWYFEDKIKSKNLKILPVGGAKEVKKLYQYLELPIQEDKKQIKGKIFCLIDTDREIISFDAKDYDNLTARRLLNDDGKTCLVNICDTRCSPPTEIEDALDAKIFYDVFKSISSLDSEINTIFDEVTAPDYTKSSRFAFDWKDSQYEKMKNYFDEGKNKIIFAQKYVGACRSSQNKTKLSWISEIEEKYI
jgi:hypothetical protein